MDISILAAELTADLLSRGYSGMSDAEAAADLNIVCRERNRSSMTGSEVLNAVDVTEWGSLDAGQKQTVWDVVHLGDVNPFGVEATLLIAVFGSGSNTIAALAVARKEAIGRAVELGLGFIYPGHIQNARM